MDLNPDEAPRRRLHHDRRRSGTVLGVSRSYAYELVRLGEIPCMRLGRRIVVPVRALDALLDKGTRRAIG
jgi:excisionase family DNA binding protein